MNQKRPPLLRRKLFIDKAMQVPLMTYFFVTTLTGVVTFSAGSVALNVMILNGFDPLMSQLFITSILLMALVLLLFMGLYVTNKIAGPLFRLRGHLKAIADGENPTKMFSRDGDFTDELIAEYNRVVDKLTGTP